jgi:hypothetical protein
MKWFELRAQTNTHLAFIAFGCHQNTQNTSLADAVVAAVEELQVDDLDQMWLLLADPKEDFAWK